jgi:hypothetical protein
LPKWSANYGGIHVIVCSKHRMDYAAELERVRKAKDSYACFFCKKAMNDKTVNMSNKKANYGRET